MYRDTDLPAVLKHSQCIFFADDTTVCISGINEPVLRQLIQYDLASVTDWFQANKLPLDVSKTNFMKFGKGSQTSEYDLHLSNNSITKNIFIKKVSSAKLLGIIIDELGWSEHINRITKNIGSGSCAIYSVKRFLSMNNMKLLYHSLIHTSVTALCCGVQHLGADSESLKLAQINALETYVIRNITNIQSVVKKAEHTETSGYFEVRTGNMYV